MRCRLTNENIFTRKFIPQKFPIYGINTANNMDEQRAFTKFTKPSENVNILSFRPALISKEYHIEKL